MHDDPDRPRTGISRRSAAATGGPTLLIRLLIPLLIAVFLLVSSVFAPGAAAQTGPAPAVGGESGQPAAGKDDPIAVVAHGGIFDANLKQIETTPEFVRTTLDLYIMRLTDEANDNVRATLEKQRQILAETSAGDDMAARFLLLEYLTNAVAPRDQAYLEVRNRSLRQAWYTSLLGLDRYHKEIDPRTQLPQAIAKLGRENGMIDMATDASGRAYIEECRRAEIPIPPQWGGDGWSYLGDLTTNFLGLGNPTQVWRADSKSPKGLCVALPRFAGSNISALGIICLGTESSNACFFDAANVPKDAKMDIEEFLGGADLVNGVCTDCHAGENLYVVHPSEPLNMAPDNRPQDWYTPLIKPSWPQNPGPFTLLAQVPINPLPPANDASCLNCHKLGQAGRFPDILALNAWKGGESDYCRVILKQAIGNTMPGPDTDYAKHVQAMLAYCGQSTPPSGEVPPPDAKDDPEIVSPPLVIGLLYACAGRSRWAAVSMAPS